MGPKSNNLFHFTKSIDYLKGILVNGFYPRYCLEDANQMDLGHLAHPMVCFCDIPISRISEHTNFYGAYGLGMTKEWGLRQGLTPLIYTTPSNAVVNLASFLLEIDEPKINKKLGGVADELRRHWFSILSLIKPIQGTMVIGGKLVEKDFYQENEWRYVPDGSLFIEEKDFESQRDTENKKIELEKLLFAPSDVRYIFVRNDSEIPLIFDFLQNSLGHFALNDIKILSTRITSLETISTDL